MYESNVFFLLYRLAMFLTQTSVWYFEMDKIPFDNDRLCEDGQIIRMWKNVPPGVALVFKRDEFEISIDDGSE